jgi:WD40 repeat protein
MTRPEQTILTRRLPSWAAILLFGGGSAIAETPRTDRLGYPLPPGDIARLGTMRLRHDSAVVALAFAPDGKTLASADSKGIIRIWETATGRELRCLRDHWPSEFGVLAYSPNGKILASAGGNGVTFWESATGAKLDRFGKWNENFMSLAFAPDGKTLAVGTLETIVWWDVGTGVRLRSLDGVYNVITAVAYSPDGKTLAYPCGHEVGVCDPATGKLIRKLRKPRMGPTAYLPSVAYSPDGKALLVSDGAGWKLMDAVTGKERAQSDGPPFSSRPAYAPNGRFIAQMLSDSGRPWMWDLTRKKDYELRGEGGRDDSYVLSFSPDSKLLASGGKDGRVRLWDVAAGKEVDWPAGDAIGNGNFALSREVKILAALDGAGRVRLWDATSSKLLHHWDAPPHLDYSYLALSPDGSQVVVPDKNDPEGRPMQMVDAATGRRRWRAKVAGVIRFAAYSPDGKLLATCGEPPAGKPKPLGTEILMMAAPARQATDLCLWDAANGRSLGRLSDHTDAISDGIFSPDGNSLATAGADSIVRVWDVARRCVRHRLKGHGGGTTVRHIAFSADGTRLATGGNDGRICVWDARTGRRLHRWAIDGEDVTCLALSPDGKLLVANAGEGCFCLWDAAAGKASPPISGHRGAVTFAAFQPDGRTLLTAGRDGTALVWDMAILRRRRSPQSAANAEPLPTGVLTRLGSIRLQHREPIGCAAFSPDGKILSTASERVEMGGLHLWDAATGKELHRLSRGRHFHARQLAFSPDGTVLATLSENAVQLWDVSSGVSLGTAVWRKDGISCFAFAPDGKTLAIAENALALWDLDTGERLRTFDDAPKEVHQLAFTADGKTLLAAGPEVVCVLDVATGKSRQRYVIKGTGLVLASNGRTLAYRVGDKRLRVCAAATGDELWQAKKSAFDYLFSPEGNLLLTRGPHEPFRLRETATGKEVCRSAENVEPVNPPEKLLCLSPDGGTLAVRRGQRVELWDVASGRERRPAGGHHRGITCLDFAPDGRTLVSGSADGTLRLWDVVVAKELRVLRGSEARINAVAFSRDGKTIASGDSRNIVRLWDAATGAEHWRFEGPRPRIVVFGAGVRSLAFSPDGRTLIAGNNDGMIYLWDVITLKLRRQFQGFATVGSAVAVSPEGKLLTSVGSDEDVFDHRSDWIRQWDAATGRRVREIIPRRLRPFASVAFSSDGKLLAARQIDPQIGFWELASGKEMFHIDTIERIAGFSLDSRYLITEDGALRDMGTGKEVGQLNGCERRISAFAISRDGRWIATGSEDTTILVQPMPRPARPKSLLTHEPTERELQSLWTALSAADPSRAWQAMRTFVEIPRQSVPFLRTVLLPHPPIDQRRLKPLLTDLDSASFAVREQARKELAGFGELAEPAMLRVLEDKPSLEVRRRVLELLEEIEKERKSPDSLRLLRATTVLERIGTAEAAKLLRRLAGGAAEARVSREAAAALERLTRRNPKP